MRQALHGAPAAHLEHATNQSFCCSASPLLMAINYAPLIPTGPKPWKAFDPRPPPGLPRYVRMDYKTTARVFCPTWALLTRLNGLLQKQTLGACLGRLSQRSFRQRGPSPIALSATDGKAGRSHAAGLHEKQAWHGWVPCQLQQWLRCAHVPRSLSRKGIAANARFSRALGFPENRQHRATIT